MDCHFLDAPLRQNLPVLLALAEIWNVNGLGYPTPAVLAYDERLARLPAHLQQVEMESNGKRVTLDGSPVGAATGPVVFGEPGTNAQHSFMQLVHQGTTPVPVRFHPGRQARPRRMPTATASCWPTACAQAEALMRGQPAARGRGRDGGQAGADPAEIARLAPHRVFPGDRPTTTLLLPRLDAFTLGQLVALYEHKVAVPRRVWGINAFDQWGVELGKQLAGPILAALERREEVRRRSGAGRLDHRAAARHRGSLAARLRVCGRCPSAPLAGNDPMPSTGILSQVRLFHRL